MNRKATFLVLGVFVLGLALGAVAMHLTEQRVFGSRMQGGRRGPAQVVQQLTTELNLSAEQQQQLNTVLEETRQKYNSIYETVRPQMEQARQDGRARIRSILTTEQLPKFEEYLRRIDERRKRDSNR